MIKRIYQFGFYALLVLPFVLHAEDQVYNRSIQSITILKTDSTTTGQKISDFFISPSEATGLKVIIPPGKETGWHVHTVPGFAYVIRGNLTIEMASGKKLEFKPGQSFAETIQVPHNGKNFGTDTVELIAFFIGQKGKPITIKK